MTEPYNTKPEKSRKKLTKAQIRHRKYLSSSIWKDIRIRLFKVRGKRCENCRSLKSIQVHHLNYARVGGDEKMSDLKILCRKCHKKVHNLISAKPKKIKRKRSSGDKLNAKRKRYLKKNKPKIVSEFKPKTILRKKAC